MSFLHTYTYTFIREQNKREDKILIPILKDFNLLPFIENKSLLSKIQCRLMCYAMIKKIKSRRRERESSKNEPWVVKDIKDFLSLETKQSFL